MALVVFLRGVNVGGHRTFRPSLLARDLAKYDVVNIGAAGTFVVRKPGPQSKFVATLRSKLPFETEIVICDGRDLAALEASKPFGAKPPATGVVWFVSVLSAAGNKGTVKHISLPAGGPWLVKTVARDKQFVLGMYRRHMKTITYLSQLDKHFGARATTRNWNTIMTIVKRLGEV
jgi:uncharacterized protein (DUF1697 family)